MPNTRMTLLSGGLIALCSCSAWAEAIITGRVHNRTEKRLAAGDEVILFRLDQRMEEESRATTDSSGSFVLAVRHPDERHLVRVVHEGVTYDRHASVGDALSLEVFDAVSTVLDVTGIAEIIRFGTQGNSLHVSDMYDIKNASDPPMTLAGERTFDVYLPEAAKIDSVMAAGPDGIGMLISAVAANGEAGHHAVSYPLRPGDTKFAFNYHLPYAGRVGFHHQIRYPVKQLALMLSSTMTFKSGSSAFHLLAASDAHVQVQAINNVKAGHVPDFEIAGTGPLPSLAPIAPAGDAAGRRAQSSSPRLIAEGVVGFGFLFCVYLVWRERRQRVWRKR